IPRAPGVEARLVRVGLAGRFFDELLSGLPSVLMPTIRATLGLSLTQVGLLEQALYYVAAVVEPGFALLIDIGRRPWLMAFGAAGIGLAVITMGLAGGLGMLLAGYALYGLCSGPLTHTADVVLVEAHPEAPDRIFARATAIDTLGALLAPLSVALVFWLGWSWRGLMVGAGALGLLYALAILGTRFPAPRPVDAPAATLDRDPSPDRDAEPKHAASAGPSDPARGRRRGRLRATLATFRANLGSVLSDPAARRWLVFLFLLELIEAPGRFQAVWLSEAAGMGQGLVGAYRVVEMLATFLALIALDRGLGGADRLTLLRRASWLLLLLYPAWLLTPGLAARFLLGAPLAFLMALYWPIGRAQAIASVPGRAGALTALTALYSLLPSSLGLGWLGDRIGLTPSLLGVYGLSMLGMLLALAWMGRTGGDGHPAQPVDLAAPGA
ncbi:MAG: MFS transporter, partial [Chloroflexi bacterium]|nr:MFS transporter [Chloroflexota bacterium]